MSRYGRPKKARHVEGTVRVSQFSPRGRPGRPDEVTLALDEYEALRLIDHKGLGQAEAAGHMRISRQTIGRLLGRARKSVADAIVQGKAIKIEREARDSVRMQLGMGR